MNNNFKKYAAVIGSADYDKLEECIIKQSRVRDSSNTIISAIKFYGIDILECDKLNDKFYMFDSYEKAIRFITMAKSKFVTEDNVDIVAMAADTAPLKFEMPRLKVNEYQKSYYCDLTEWNFNASITTI